MVEHEFYKTRDDGVELCNIFSNTKHKLKQIETQFIYDYSVIDVIAGYDEDGKPYSRYTYEETDEMSTEELKDAKEALNILGVN